MERLALACGGEQVNSVDDLTKEQLGYAGVVYEQVCVCLCVCVGCVGVCACVYAGA